MTSATPNTPANGGQILTWQERYSAQFSKSTPTIFPELHFAKEEIADLRASLAAPAIPTVDRNAVHWSAEEICNAAVKAGLGVLECNSLIVTLKSAAPASMPQPAISPQQAAIEDAALYGTGAYRHHPNGTNEHIPYDQLFLATAPVAQPAAQGAVEVLAQRLAKAGVTNFGFTRGENPSATAEQIAAAITTMLDVLESGATPSTVKPAEKK